MMKQTFWITCVLGFAAAALLATGCIHASMGNMH
jgi:hypothetical protein